MHLATSLAVLAACLGVSVKAQGAVEEPEFNATQALADLGIDLSDLPPELIEPVANVSKRSTSLGCAIAVSQAFDRRLTSLTVIRVFFAGHLVQLGDVPRRYDY